MHGRGGQAFLVGGSVRDRLFGQSVKDFDFEVFGLDPPALEAALASVGKIDYVGKQFGVYKLKGTEIDVALPRREQKSGPGHRGFAIEADPFLSIEAAAERRDFTMNALYLDPLTDKILDPVGGQVDIEKRVLRHVSSAFSEDPLRVLRGMQMVARFGLSPHPDTVALCRTVLFEHLPFERVGEEFYKLLTKGECIGDGLRFLEACGWLQYFPELEALVDCPQDPHWHPEGSVWVHTCHCLDVFASERTGDPLEDWVVGLGVLCHDLGKPVTTFYQGGRWRSPQHEDVGVPIAKKFLSRLTGEKRLIEDVLPMVSQHMRPYQFFSSHAGDTAVRRLASKVKRIDRLVRVCRADKQGRPPLKGENFKELDWLESRAEVLRIKDAAPKPWVQGRDLIALGVEAGPHMGAMLKRVFEAQLDGDFDDLEQGIQWACAYYNL
ncbi:MAG: HD domain-containing protein [Opitutales bacterium]|nr:HD domain-containing protein [Opitutales bacterium]